MLDVICLSNMPYLRIDGSIEDIHPLGNLTPGKRYKAARENGWLRVWDDFEEDYLYPSEMFAVC